MVSSPPRLALVGDRSPSVRAHVQISTRLRVLRERDGLDLDAYWIPTGIADGDLSGFDGIWLVPGSPYRSESGAVAAVRTARERGIPFLGTCGGFQHAVLEYARNVCGLAGARHAENNPGAALREALITPLACALQGREEEVVLTPDSLAEQIIGAERSIERYLCAYAVNPRYHATLAAHGMRFTGHDGAGGVRVAELPDHPFFIATLFQPELAGAEEEVHPILAAFAAAIISTRALRVAENAVTTSPATAAVGTSAVGTPDPAGGLTA